MNSKFLAVAVGALVVAVTATTALAGHQTSGVKSYTGCLVSGDGVIIKIKEGNAPKSACTGGQVEAHFSGGDITSIAGQAGGGLTGGGTNGATTLSIRTDCSSGEVVKWGGSSWDCAADANSTYTAGTGLDLSGGEFSVEESYRLPQGCASGEAATRNPAVGGGAATWICDQYATADQACTSGQFTTGITALGSLDCAAPAGAGTVQGFAADTATKALAGTGNVVISKTLPAGKYLLFASVTLVNRDVDSESSGSCDLAESTTLSFTLNGLGQGGGGHTESLSLVSHVTHAGGPVQLLCSELTADVDVSTADLVAIKVDSIG